MALHRYLNTEGTQVPSVTTILKDGIPKPALVGWAAKTMTEKTRTAIRELLAKHKRDMPKRVIDRMVRAADEAVVPNLYDDKTAADAGTIAHEVIENHLQGRPITGGKVDDLAKAAGEAALTQAMQAFESFKRWLDMVRFELVATEVSLVDDDLGYGGTVDYVGLVNGELALIDWKTSKRVYEEYLAQVGAYAHLWECGRLNYVDQEAPKTLGTVIDSVHVLKLGKGSTTFQHSAFYAGALDDGYNLFRAAFDVSRSLERCKKHL